MSYIQIEDAAGNTVTFTPADFDYEVEVRLAILINERHGSYGVWDNGSQYDYRTLRARWVLSNTDAENFHAIFRDRGKSRAKSVNLILPSGSGFFPFGPDKGDEGTFQVRLIGLNQIGTGNEQWRYFVVEVEFVAESFPAYTPPAQTVEGPLQIGSITGLRFPPDFADLINSYAYNSNISRDGTPYTVDLSSSADKYSNSLLMVLNQANMAALINHLTETVRGNSFEIKTVDNAFLFGRDKDSSALTTYTCKLLSNLLTVKAPAHNRFEMSFDTYLTSAA